MSRVHVALRNEAIDVTNATNFVGDDHAGAIDVFVGVVRDHNEGQSVTLLEYEAYASMAEREMARIAAEVGATFSTFAIWVEHRVGALRVGDAAVICAASAVHRGEAFDACRALIDRIKADVPIWKREHGPDGAYWVGWRDARCHGEHA